jgi:hypothetical protein
MGAIEFGGDMHREIGRLLGLANGVRSLHPPDTPKI